MPATSHLPTVVLADDEPTVLDSLKELLEQMGFTVLGTADDGAEALALIEELTPDVALIDLNMPFVSGLDVARIVRDRVPSVAVVLLSAYDDVSLQLEAERVPVASYLVKGCSSTEIIEATKNACSMHRRTLGEMTR